jgi:hypothetical protein
MPRLALLCLVPSLLAACAGPPPAPVTAPAIPQAARDSRAESPSRESNEYSLYELLDPDSSQFHILFEVTAITPGATAYFNPIRKGSVATDESVRDRATSQPLRFEVVSGGEARTSGLPEADPGMDYIRIQLPHPVPEVGGVRLLIEKTYKDAKSYHREGTDRIVFSRTLGIRRNAVVLPAGWELAACNVPAQVLPQPDGRARVSLMHTGPDALPVTIVARRTTKPMAAAGKEDERLSERAHQDREIVYFLRAPETHAFDLYHDYTESRPGVDRYLNVVRKGSEASGPSARNLDTGEALPIEVQTGEAILRAGLHPGEEAGEVPADSEVVIARFPAVQPGASVRLRIAETYTDPKSYRLEGDELVFDRTFGRPRNSVVLPAGWSLTASSIPAVVTEMADGRVRLDFVNPRNDEIGVLIRARRPTGGRPGPPPPP